MTNPDYTALLFIIDRSGSMHTIKEDMEGGINGVLEEQKNLPGDVTVDVAYFDDVLTYDDRFLSLESASIKIQPRGMTALHDAIVVSTRKFGDALSQLPEDERPGNVLVVIVTDGLENSSREFNTADVKETLTLQQDTYNWQFVYLGANQDAIQTGENLGLRKGSSYNYVATRGGTVDAANIIGATITSARTRIF
ncbi:Hypothetical Protein OBI_RACECAR_153 [Arthrobacter phage Racecar]|nr:hypothetical protein PBI_RACECAR_235 [Arthrobacter phage Racecar]